MQALNIKEVLGQMHKTLECAICLELLTNPVSTKCDHQFCSFCITQFLGNKRLVPCPLCKVPLTKRGLQERGELTRVVNGVKKLITAFEADTGERCTPSNGPQSIFPATPEDLNVRKLTKQKLVDKFYAPNLSRDKTPEEAEKYQNDYGEIAVDVSEETEDNSAFFLPKDTPTNQRRSSRHRQNERSAPIDPRYSGEVSTDVEGKQNANCSAEVIPSTAVPVEEQFLKHNKSNDSEPETSSGPRTRSRQRNLKQNGASYMLSKTLRHQQVDWTAKTISKNEDRNVSQPAVVDQKTNLLFDNGTGRKKQVDQAECEEIHNIDQDIGDTNGHRTGNLEIKRNRRFNGARGIQTKCTNSSDQIRNLGENGHNPEEADHNKQSEGRSHKVQTDELMRYLEEGSCGARWNQGHATTDSVSVENVRMIHSSVKIDGDSKILSTTTVKGKNKTLKVSKNTGADSERDKSSVVPGNSSLPLSPKKSNVLLKDQTISNIAFKREQVAKCHPMKENNPQFIVSNLFGLSQSSNETNKLGQDSLTPESDRASTSSTQQLMKPKPPVSRTYSKEMQNSFRSERVKNWAGALPQPNWNGPDNVSCLRGLTTKEKINAKKRANKSNPQIPSSTVGLPSPLHGSVANKSDGHNSEELKKQSGPFQFEQPVTPVPRRKCIFKSRQQQFDSSNATHDHETTQKTLTDEDPYEFKGGQTPVKSKRNRVSQKNRFRNTNNKTNKKLGSLEAQITPTELNKHVEPLSGETDRKSKEDSNNHLISLENEKGSDMSVVSKVPPETGSFTKQMKKKTVHFAASDPLDGCTNISENPPELMDISDKLTSSQEIKEKGKQITSATVEDDVTEVAVGSSESVNGSVANENESSIPCAKIPDVGNKETELEHLSSYDSHKNLTENTCRKNNQTKQQGLQNKNQCNTKDNKRPLARRRGKQRQKSEDGETFSQKSDREMVKLIHKITEAEDYDLMFSTQEAQRKIEEEHLKQQNLENAFGFESSEDHTGKDSPYNNLRDGSDTAMSSEITEEGDQGIGKIGTANPGQLDQHLSLHESGVMGKDLVSQEITLPAPYTKTAHSEKNICIEQEAVSDNLVACKNAREYMNSQDNMKDILKKPELGKANETVPSFKSPAVLRQRKQVLETASYTPTHRIKAQNFPRPNFSEMIQVSPVDKGVMVISSPSTAGPHKPEIPHSSSKSVNNKRNKDDKKRIMSASAASKLGSPMTYDQLTETYQDIGTIEENEEKIQNAVEVKNSLSCSLIPDSYACRSKTSSTVISPTVSNDASIPCSYVDTECPGALPHTPHLSLKSKDTFNSATSLLPGANTGFDKGHISQEVVLALDTCVDNLEMIPITTVTYESDTVVLETMDFDEERHGKKQKETKICDKVLGEPKKILLPDDTSVSQTEPVSGNVTGPADMIRENDISGDSIEISQSEMGAVADSINTNTYILINSEASQQGKDGTSQAKISHEKSQETLSESSSQSQSILQPRGVETLKSATCKHSRSGKTPWAHTTINEKQKDSNVVSLSSSSTDFSSRHKSAKTEESLTSARSKSHNDISRNSNQVQSCHKRKFVGDELISHPQKTPLSKIGDDKPVSSAPSRFNFSDSEDEDDVLIVHRSKRKCLSLDGSPLRPVVFGPKQNDPQKLSTSKENTTEEQQKDVEMLGETEALEVLDKWTEPDTENDVSDESGKEMREKCDEKDHLIDVCNEKESISIKESAGASGNSVEESIPLTDLFVEVTPVGKVKYIDSSGKYVIDMNDQGSLSQDENIQPVMFNPSFQRCLFPDAQDESLPHISGVESEQGAPHLDKHSLELDQNRKQQRKSPDQDSMTKKAKDIITSNSVNSPDDSKHVESNKQSSDKCITQTSSGGTSKTEKHTARGLAKRNACMNLELLPKHPRASLSPASKAAILASFTKPKVNKSTPRKENNPVDSIDVNAESEDDLESGVKMASTKWCEKNIDDDSTKSSEALRDRKFQSIEEDGKKISEEKSKHRGQMDKTRKKMQFGQIYHQNYEYEKRQLEKHLFGQEAEIQEINAEDTSERTETDAHGIHYSDVSETKQPGCSADDKDKTDVSFFELELSDLSDLENEEKKNGNREKHLKESRQLETSQCEGSIQKIRVTVRNDDEIEANDHKANKSSPLTSSPVTTEVFKHDDLDDQPGKTVLNVDVIVEEDEEDDDEEVCRNRRKRIKRQQITSDSEDSASDGDPEPNTNVTSSSAYSSQSETLTTQQQEALEGDVAKLHKEIQEFEAQLGKDNTSMSAAPDPGDKDKTLSDVFVIDESPMAVKSLPVPDEDDDEDSDDLFVSSSSPSPPQHLLLQKTAPKKSAASRSKKDVDQLMKQFQSPGGSVRTKKSLDFTMSNSLHKATTDGGRTETVVQNNEYQDGNDAKSKIPWKHPGNASFQGSLGRHVDGDLSVVSETESRPASPVLLSQKSCLSQLSQGRGKKECEDTKSHRGMKEKSARELCFVASGMGREENLMVLKLVEKYGSKYTSKFTADATHVIMKPVAGYNRVCDRTLKFFQGVAHKCWIVSFGWVEDSLKANQILPEEKYEILGDTSGGEFTNGPKKSRLADGNFFADFAFACVGNSTEMPKETLCDLLTACGAVVVDHPIGLLSQQSKHKIVVRCSDAEDEPTSVELDMFNGLYKHGQLLTVMREWVLDSLGSFTLLPLADYILNSYDNLTVPF